ncbi:peptide chain release factor N(5)-glutamine methyltransferase [Ruminococcus sp. JL13D9]|uniref:peptide chain release factor N(5)-glutamine methyltransferase n=1 Tax=Ruminococcus sp. JL13D9 TaxID=3233381 RepID=UPI00389AE8DC
MLKDLYIKLRGILSEAEIEAPELEARLLIEGVTGMNRASQIANSNSEISGEIQEKLISMAQKRAEHLPLQYILGKWNFMGFEFKVGEGVLIPRDDTEVLVGLCLDYLKASDGKTALDLCAGSGAVSVALDKLANADVTAVELSDKAYNFLLENIKGTNIKPHKGDIFECYRDFEAKSFDLIASNPPYIKTDEIETLQTEVGYEPKTALDGGADGLDFYRAIARRWTPLLKSGGAMAFELGEGQAEYVGGLMADHGYINIKTAKDLGGTDRAIIGILP